MTLRTFVDFVEYCRTLVGQAVPTAGARTTFSVDVISDRVVVTPAGRAPLPPLRRGRTEAVLEKLAQTGDYAPARYSEDTRQASYILGVMIRYREEAGGRRVFGGVSGILPGALFESRIALAASGVHRPTQAGISYAKSEGADSIVLSGGYVDDEDLGNVIVYTGMGGRDPNTGRQIADQPFDRGNSALAMSCKEGLPVRVTRGSEHDSPFSPKSGYEYAGLYRVEDYWHERGRHGFVVWRFRLRREGVQLDEAPDREDSPRPLASPSRRQESTVLRIVRDTRAAKNLKQLYNYACQACGEAIKTPAGLYAEAAHIRPLGRPHNGPDHQSNLLCLCPNHHVMFDSGGFSIADDGSLIGLPGRLAVHARHQIAVEHFQYHRGHYGFAEML